MGTHLWSQVNAELQNVFDTRVFVKRFKKEVYTQKVLLNYGILRNLHIHPPTHLTFTP